MAVYRETDGSIVREYTLEHGSSLFQKQSEKALLEIVQTKEYGTAFFVDGELQLTEKDEYIYHESLVHPCLMTAASRKKVCILGGGDGCAAREVLKWSDVEHVNIIDWDTDVTELFKHRYSFLNGWSLDDSHVTIENKNIQDLLHEDRTYDCILIDLLDPKDTQIDLWYDILFLAKHWTTPTGSLVINAGGISPWQVDMVNWLLQMIESKTECKRVLYKAFVPSFGREWCFILASKGAVSSLVHAPLPSNLKYFNATAWNHIYTHTWTKDYFLYKN
jgi:spermidine synthase